MDQIQDVLSLGGWILIVFEGHKPAIQGFLPNVRVPSLIGKLVLYIAGSQMT